jgi:hypothetical protein
MRLVWAFDAVLLVLTIGREERRDLVYAGRAGTPKRTRYVADDLADPELVLAHTILLSHPIALRRRKFLIQRLKTSTTARRRSNCYVFLNSPRDSASVLSSSHEARPIGSI